VSVAAQQGPVQPPSLTIDAPDREELPLAVSTGGQRLATGGFDGTPRPPVAAVG